MCESYFRYTKKYDQLGDVSGLLVTALKESSGFKPEEYHRHYHPEDFLKVSIYMESVKGGKATIDDLIQLVPPSVFETDFDWALTAVIITTKGIVAYYVGFSKTQIVLNLPMIKSTEYETRSLQMNFGDLRHARVQIGEDRRISVWFGASNDIPDVLQDIDSADAGVAEYLNDALINTYIISADEPIVVHQYLS